MTAIPYVGGALFEATFGVYSSLKMGRLEKTIAELAHDVRKLTEAQVDRAFIETEDFMDIVDAGLRGATQTASESKRTRFRQVIVGACKPQVHRTRAETFVAAVTELNDDDVELLRAIRHCEAEGHPDPVGGRRLPAASESLDMLQRFGLVQAPRAGGDGFLVTQAHRPDRPIITDLGNAFFNWVLATENDPEAPGVA